MNLFFKAAAVALPTLATGIVLAASTSQDAGLAQAGGGLRLDNRSAPAVACPAPRRPGRSSSIPAA